MSNYFLLDSGKALLDDLTTNNKTFKFTHFHIGETVGFAEDPSYTDVVDIIIKSELLSNSELLSVEVLQDEDKLIIICKIPSDFSEINIGNVVLFYQDTPVAMLILDEVIYKEEIFLSIYATLEYSNIKYLYNTRNYHNLLELATPPLVDNPVFYELLTSVNDKFNQHVTELRLQFQEIRDLTKLDRKLLFKYAYLLGSNFIPNELTTDQLERFVNLVTSYYKHKGTKYFIDFLSFIMDKKFQIKQLWSKDYINFDYLTPNNITVYNGGEWYPTSHVELIYSLDDFENTTINQAEVTSLFYSLAPVNLVLHFFNGSSVADMPQYVYAVGYENYEFSASTMHDVNSLADELGTNKSDFFVFTGGMVCGYYYSSYTDLPVISSTYFITSNFGEPVLTNDGDFIEFTL